MLTKLSLLGVKIKRTSQIGNSKYSGSFCRHKKMNLITLTLSATYKGQHDTFLQFCIENSMNLGWRSTLCENKKNSKKSKLSSIPFSKGETACKVSLWS